MAWSANTPRGRNRDAARPRVVPPKPPLDTEQIPWVEAAPTAQAILPVARLVEAPPARIMEQILSPAPSIQWAKVGLPPDLPMLTYTSSEVWHPERIGALAIYCSDGRWGDAFDEFCHKCLNIPRYDRFAVPGGPAWLARHETSLSNAHSAAKEQLDFLVHVHELDRIVLIAHYGCAFYHKLLHQEPDQLLPAQLADVRDAATCLEQWFPTIQAETYLAMRQGNRLAFHRVER